jgi:hypothetical protein
LEHTAIKARRVPGESLIGPLPKSGDKNKDKNTLVTTHHPNDRALTEIIHTNLNLLGKNLTTSFLHSNRPIVAYRRPPNLRDMLVKADISIKPKKGINQEGNSTFLHSTNTPSQLGKQLRQTTMTDFLTTKGIPSATSTDEYLNSNPEPSVREQTKKPPNKLKICTNPNCRYCSLIDKS